MFLYAQFQHRTHSMSNNYYLYDKDIVIDCPSLLADSVHVAFDDGVEHTTPIASVRKRVSLVVISHVL